MLTTEKLFNFLQKYKLWIVLFWISATLCSAFFAMGLLNATIWILNPPKGYPSYDAYNEMNEYFPDLLNADAEIIVIELKSGSHMANIENNITEKLCDQISQHLYNLNDPILATLQYFYAYKDKNISTAILERVIKPEFIDPSGNMMVFIIQLNVDGVSTQRVSTFLDHTKSILKNLTNTNNLYSTNYNLQLTGMMTLIEDCISVLTADIISKDLILLPVIFIFMIYVIGSYKLVLLPFICFGMVTSISFALFRIVAENWMTIPPENPSFMLFISMAICVDYGMFLLTRFITAIQIKNADTNEAIKDMLAFSGHVIVLSGSILILLEIGFGLFFPYGGLNAAGYGIAFCVFLSITISISFTTSLILLFPSFFSDIERIPKCIKFFCCCCCETKIKKYQRKKLMKINTAIQKQNENDFSVNSTHEPMISVKNSTNNLGINSIVSQQESSIQFEIEHLQKQNVYFYLAQMLTRMPYKCLFPLFIYAAMIPVLYQLLSWETTMSPNMMFPTNTDSADAYNKLVNNFNPGLMQPFYILSVPKNENNSIWNQTYFDDICLLANNLMDIGYTNNSDMLSFMFLPNPDNPQKIECLKESRVHKRINDPNSNELYLQLFNMTVDTEQSASIMILYPTFNPFGDNAQNDADKWRDFVTDYGNKHKDTIELYVHSEVFWQIDLLKMEYARLPVCLVVMLSLIFIIIGITFKSFLLPTQLLLCIVIPVMFVYGCCVGVYSKGWFNWTYINGYKGLYSSNGLFWPTPILSLSLLLGLALDYEIFLLSRIYEYRYHLNYNTNASIILALSTTGPVISSAGVVMALAFCGLLLETVPSCDQFGFIFVIGVLIDTFVIRPILVPSILSFFGDANWYPTKVQKCNLKNEYHQIIDPIIEENIITESIEHN